MLPFYFILFLQTAPKRISLQSISSRRFLWPFSDTVFHVIEIDLTAIRCNIKLLFSRLVLFFSEIAFFYFSNAEKQKKKRKIYMKTHRNSRQRYTIRIRTNGAHCVLFKYIIPPITFTNNIWGIFPVHLEYKCCRRERTHTDTQTLRGIAHRSSIKTDSLSFMLEKIWQIIMY